MEIVNVIPRGYCQGVVRAIRIAQKTAEEHPNQHITMLGMLVHNQYVVDACKELGIDIVEEAGASRLELLERINDGIVLFTAHGVSDEVKEKAAAKGLLTADATCPDVLKTHEIVKQHTQTGDVIYIGKKNHPESEGTIGLSQRVHLVTSVEDVEDLADKPLENILVTNQTTLSILDIQDIRQAILEHFPEAVMMDEICPATRMRQEAVRNLTDVDLLFVVGDVHSNNTAQLASIGTANGIPSLRIDSVLDIKEEMIANKKRIAVTSGSSTPNSITNQVVEFLREYAKTKEFNLPSSIDVRLL